MSLVANNLSDTQEDRVIKIMIVDDLSINRTLVRVLLNKRNIEVVEAKNGKEAINCFNLEQPDLVLMDISMPVMDGVEAMAKIRMVNGYGETTPIIAFTSGEHKESKTELFEQGFSEYLLKPFKKRELYDKISLFLPMRGIQNGVSSVKVSNI